jgi:hypothetical protein
MDCELTGRVNLKFVAILMWGLLWVSDGSAQAPAPGIFRLPAGQQGAIPGGIGVSIEPDGKVSF